MPATPDTTSPFARLIHVIRRMDEIFDDAEERSKYVNEETGFIKNGHLNGERMDNEELQALFFELDPLCDQELIDNEGRAPSGSALMALRERGYNAEPGERDGFGWLTGVLHGRNFKHVFG